MFALRRCASTAIKSTWSVSASVPRLAAGIRFYSDETSTPDSSAAAQSIRLKPLGDIHSSSTPQSNSAQVWGFLVQTGKNITNGAGDNAEEKWKKREASVVQNLQKPDNPYTGRSVAVHNHEVGAAFTALRRIMSANAVARELRLVQRHEKKGVKRRRLKSERWRRRFAHEVRKKVKLVNEIRARGS
ncbi:uncharacterized protein LAESUDRAFT_692200 [Laetiporus sulphureus 93-53]|uniref:Ribosomal protein S21 n=1 Tax=Laetiporus sulphureus 93-53 TaxID=1314785 RepID=A0A165H8M9_9APHY|nr:uncharacterized protein LAESUDRAFT_692200 [Laetiporus sulphureus 93-53]KZT11395.1 hypothetical protein LAESUDRAFT_692200 [Laetiporus sulphureus 93-53]